jgi:hypothetical protein
LALRGAEAPLFHGPARICQFFRNRLRRGLHSGAASRLNQRPSFHREHEGLVLTNTPKPIHLVAGQFEKHVPAAVKAVIDFDAFTARLKPRPFNTLAL